MLNNKVLEVTERLIERSKASRQAFLQHCEAQRQLGKNRTNLSCGNLAHATAASCEQDKAQFLNFTSANVAIITSYNDMVSAHQPYQCYPDKIKQSLAHSGHTAQVAGGVPAMCDGVTQGQVGMDLSLFSRDLIAQSTALSLSHNVYDASLLLGVCDKIAPGLLMGALSYAHLPTAFVPSGLMATGISNDEKVTVRQQFAAKTVGKQALLDMECQSYHSSGTCTFYGTANTNQLVFEAMGLMLPGSAFVHPNSELREKLTTEASIQIASRTIDSPKYRPLYQVVTEKTLINGIVALLSSGGSTNHTIHMVALARSAGIDLKWDDINALSEVVPLLVNVYPNGSMDMNAFQNAGSVPALLHRLNEQNLLHTDVVTAFGSFESQLNSPKIEDDQLVWHPTTGSLDHNVIAASGQCYRATGGLKLLSGNLGRGVVKVSAVDTQYHQIEAPARVFTSQHDVEKAYQNGELNQDCVVVVSHNGPAANGMPELHKLMPILGNLQKAGYKVALVTDGRLSGASGKVPSVIHLSPEATRGGAIGLIRDGDKIRIDCTTGLIEALVDIEQRESQYVDLTPQQTTWGRQLFDCARQNVSSAEEGASFIV
ncbi:phosphogluconate dehydratase [Vibrio hippocampi]|uniref:Phosphogluconate dehydratase n=1 Tax=Vibrio hippocampi TaxID=654686 RepID=A0ABM8ZFR7_9VIBR|nr:phosphogluconate dehydratase [Vibrio hippocampi]CAH0525068.1 Phosphogluconate dehydratase [Vibrio hippocampi]